MKNYISLFIIHFLIGLVLPVESQDLISYKKLKTMSKMEISNTLFIPAKYDVDIFVIEYTTKKMNFKKDTASGVLAVAKDSKFRFPTAVYNHGTVDNRNDVPSKGSGEQLIAVAIASYGYHCVAPDYIGLGISKGVHPYVNPESEAWATIDMIKASHSLSATEPIYFNDQVFVTGYSQGGHAAMATAFTIEQRKIKGIDSMDLTIAVPMSGPYSISGEMVSFTMGDNEYNFCAYLGSAFLSAKMAHFDLLSDTELEDVFVPEYAQLIRQYESETIGLFTMNDIMVAKLKENGGKVLPKRMLKDDFRIDFMANPNNPLKLALRRMDICNWVPVAPVKMLYCKADDQVTYRNAVYTDSLMRANGALNVSAQDVLTTGNHSTCFYPALLKMISIFNGLQRIDPLSDINELPEEEISAWPNPASGHLNIEVNGNVDQQFKVSIYNSLGRKVFNSVVKSSSVQSIELSKFETGIYYILFYKRDHLISRDKFSVIK